MIKLQVIGYLGKDATVSVLNGNNVINFNVAHSDKYKNAQGVQMEKTTWVSCNYWVEKTTIAQYLRKGTMVFVEGIPEVSAYEDRNRNMQAELKLRVFQVQLLGSKDKADGSRSQNYSAAEAVTSNSPGYQPVDNGSDDLPF